MSAPDDLAATAARGEPRRDRSIGALFGDLADDLRRLFWLEIELFTREFGDNLRRCQRGGAAMAAGVLLAFSAWLVLLAAAVLGLATVLRPWLAALIIAALVLAVAAIFLFVGQRQLRTSNLVPRRTLNALREDRVWIKERMP
jgi:hypothetical protein